jgi:hydrogenase-4 component F
MNEFLVAVLMLAPTLGGLVVWRRTGRTAERIALTAIALAAIAGLALAGSVLAGSALPGGKLASGRLIVFDGVVVIDAFGAFLLGLTVIVAGMATMASPRYVRHELAGGLWPAHIEGRFYALMLWFVASLAAVPLLDNLGLLWVAIEATTVVSALLVGISRTSDALEAAWKYLILGTVGVGFALLGTLLIYASSVQVLGESSDAMNWTRLMTIAPMLNPNLLRLAFVFALAGYGTKIGLVPFHTWLPDAHSQAPSPISALLSGVSLTAALYALVRFHLVAVGGLGDGFSSGLLIAFGLLSLAVALPFMIRQEDLKRLLAYSSIEHMGLVTLGIGFGGPLALLGVVLHIGLHAITKATLFLSAGELVQQYGSRRLSAIRGALTGAPAAGVLGSGILVLGGLPPSGIFVTEFAIVVGGALRGYVVAAAIAAALLALAFVALAFHGTRLMWGRRGAGLGVGSGHGSGPDHGNGSSRGQDSGHAVRRSSAPGSEGAQEAGGSGSAVLAGRGTVARLAAPLFVVAVLGLWTPGPLATALDAVRAVLGGPHA